MVPKVTIKGTTLVALMIVPLINPHPAPVKVMRTNAKNIHRVNANASSPKNVSGAAVGAFFSITANTVPQRVRAVPADRSIPPEMMMIVIPKAGTAMSAALLIMTRKFRVERNCPCPQYLSARAKKTSMATNAKRGPNFQRSFFSIFSFN